MAFQPTSWHIASCDVRGRRRRRTRRYAQMTRQHIISEPSVSVRGRSRRREKRHVRRGGVDTGLWWTKELQVPTKSPTQTRSLYLRRDLGPEIRASTTQNSKFSYINLDARGVYTTVPSWLSEQDHKGKKVLLDAIEEGATGRMGVKTLQNSHWPFGTSKLPDFPIDITRDLILYAVIHNTSTRSHFDGILGPDYDPIVHESALMTCAQLGMELWFFRLLELAQRQSLVITDKAALIEAAKDQPHGLILQVCKRLIEGKPISFQGTVFKKPFHRTRKEILHRVHYFTRQGRRLGRPRIPKIFRRGFEKYRHELRCNRRP
ncbi:hypothetical protein DM02DRAFT_617351 [Periconia macrospinosa]|uniref:Uncharacterized protein n=1 Tax=Periconia macrospinosa TaxID=97972 RepID=A0A2V1DDT8_9PLEO|nr:hypothetical protein DM02DRAFT_617351 [Periconia macrospinosa]